MINEVAVLAAVVYGSAWLLGTIVFALNAVVSEIKQQKEVQD